jgi:hypothetical protein
MKSGIGNADAIRRNSGNTLSAIFLDSRLGAGSNRADRSVKPFLYSGISS